MLDIDHPGEVIAAAACSAVAGATAVGQAVGAARQLVVHPRECSPFDEDLLVRLDWVRGVVTETADAIGVLSQATYQHAARTAQAYADADAAGGRAVADIV
ncbi:hypothetical protein ACFROC_00495 [Nocardia tengchongensis]|uniref:hypothetical protein n=1 Tax=Nocardia tengchongensis TaxID=2055889 RepID=UPI0036B05F23